MTKRERMSNDEFINGPSPTARFDRLLETIYPILNTLHGRNEFSALLGHFTLQIFV